ncbi:DUF4303 domain-containing protein [bacterium]|nr:MAG: DUF4303 domain-containing protein [bacterium]
MREAMAAAFADLRAAHPEERFYAYALYTDDGVAGISPAANSEEGLAAKIAEYGDDAEPAYLRWTTSEWAYEGIGWERTEATYHAITKMGQAADDFDAFHQDVLTLMRDVLADLDAEGLFGRGEAREAVTLLCSITDSDDAEAYERQSVHALNPPAVVERYEADWASE